MSQLQYGLPLTSPVSQTILPIIVSSKILPVNYRPFDPKKMPTGIDLGALPSGVPSVSAPVQTPIVIGGGMEHGFYFITKTVFTGSETSFTLPSSTVPIPLMSVTRPAQAQIGNPGYLGAGQPQVQQFMAAVWDRSVESQKPWAGYAEWVNTNSTGMYANWVQPADWVHANVSWGVLNGSYMGRMDLYQSGQGTITPPPPPTASNGNWTWTAHASYDSLNADCPFFDVNWFQLFNASYNVSAKQQDGTYATVPISIVPTTVPAQFKVQVVNAIPQGNAMSVVAGGGVVYDTLRFIVVQSLGLQPGQTGTYNFAFKVTDDRNQSTNVTLTLTVNA